MENRAIIKDMDDYQERFTLTIQGMGLPLAFNVKSHTGLD